VRKEEQAAPAEEPSTYGPATGALPPAVPLSFEGLLRAAERTGVVFFRWDRSGGFLYLSDSVEAVLGYTSRELMADPPLFARLVHKESVRDLEAAVRRLRTEGPERAQFLTRVRAKDGRDVWLSTTLHPVRDPGGAVAGWEGVSHDATELVRAREAAFEGQQVFRTLFEDGPMPMVLFDPHTLVIERANARACELYGYPRADLEGSFISEVVAPDEWPRTLDHVQRAAQNAFVTFLHRTHHRRVDGTLFPVQVAGSNVMVGGRVKRLSVVLDLTHFEASGATTHDGEAAGGAQGAASPRDDVELFFDLIAHDVTNYLTAVRGYLEIVMAAQDSPPSTKRLVEVARTQATNALDLIRDTKRLATLERDAPQAASEGDLVTLLNEAADRVEPILRERKFRVRREFEAHIAPVRRPDLLREVFVNLVHNAVKYDSHDEVVIDIGLRKVLSDGKPCWRVRIADRGIGILDGDRRHLFDRGLKQSRAAARAEGTMAPEGSGIGLSLCKMVVERAGGTIGVESRIPGAPSQGTAFIVTLPSA
jgi:PAS domain S-box-containing protein